MKYIIKKLMVFIVLFNLFNTASSQISHEEYKQAVEFCISRLSDSIQEIDSIRYPILTKGLGEWEVTEPSYWTSGFFPGCLWYAHKLHPEEEILNAALNFTQGLEDQKFNTETHDIGFMIFNSFGNGYRFEKKTEYKEIILEAANSLSKRYNPNVGCTQSWNGEFQVIVDNMMNLELLFWAAKNSGDKKLYDIAVSHANKTIENHIREDGSSFHVVVFDTATGKVIEKRTAQGLSDNSAWARGQAWGIYGFTMSYRETHDTTYLNTAMKMADYFIKHLPDDFIPYWDLNLPENSPRKFKDASASTIALSALLELRKYTGSTSMYDSTINNMMISLLKNYLSINTNSSGIILHSAYNVNSDNPFYHDASTIWGDYYFLEALYRYKESFLN
jgi:hypothetical protein